MVCGVVVAAPVVASCSFGAFPGSETLPIAFLADGNPTLNIVPKRRIWVDLPRLSSVFSERRGGVAEEARTLSLAELEGGCERSDWIRKLLMTHSLLLDDAFSSFLPQPDSFIQVTEDVGLPFCLRLVIVSDYVAVDI